MAGASSSGPGSRGRVLVGAIGEYVLGQPTEGRAYLFYTCPADFNGNGVVDSQDFFDFANGFFASPARGDFNRDGTTNAADFFDFLTAFFAGYR
jgi:hypothetical protein